MTRCVSRIVYRCSMCSHGGPCGRSCLNRLSRPRYSGESPKFIPMRSLRYVPIASRSEDALPCVRFRYFRLRFSTIRTARCHWALLHVLSSRLPHVAWGSCRVSEYSFNGGFLRIRRCWVRAIGRTMSEPHQDTTCDLLHLRSPAVLICPEFSYLFPFSPVYFQGRN